MTIWIHRTNLSVNQRIWFVTELTEIGFLRVHFQAAEVRTYRKSIRECWSRRFGKQTESQQDLVELFLWSTSLVKELVILLVFFFFLLISQFSNSLLSFAVTYFQRSKVSYYSSSFSHQRRSGYLLLLVGS